MTGDKASLDSSPTNARFSASVFSIPGHEIIGEIARGGMGIVYRARQIETEREVALKMLLPHQLNSEDVRERFRTEIRVVAGLDHPAILPVFEVGEAEETPYFTMKIAAGGSLASRILQFRSRFRESAELMLRIAEAVHFAHEHGVLHRDLKPGNILFDGNGRVYVSDFGLAKLAGLDTELTRSTDILGTPQYLAPEIAESSARHATTRSDLYSLGAILYELLSGVPPFQAESLPALLRKIAEHEPSAFPSDIPCDLGVICLHCLAKEPSQRYGSVRELADDLQRWLAGEPITARPISAAGRLWRWTHRNPILATTSGALIVCATAAVIALLVSYRQVQIAFHKTAEARDAARLSLADALQAQSQALGAAKSVGQRYIALDAIHRAAQIHPTLALRNEAVAALARPDLRELQRLAISFGGGGTPVVFSSDFQNYVCPEMTGGFAVRRVKDQEVIAGFPGTLRKPARWFVMSPDDRLVSAVLDDYSLEIWAIRDRTMIARWPPSFREPPIAAFSPDGITLAGFISGEGCFIQNVTGAGRHLIFTNGPRPIYLRFDPEGKQLGVVRDPGAVEVWDCAGEIVRRWSIPIPWAVPWLSWSSDGEKLVVAADDGKGVRVLSAEKGELLLAYSRHLRYPRQFEFAPSGNIVASLGEDWSLRFWDSLSGQDLLAGVGRHRVMRFSADGRYLTTAPNDEAVAIMELAPDAPFHELSTDSPGSRILCSGLGFVPGANAVMSLYPEARLWDQTRRSRLPVEAGVLSNFSMPLVPFSGGKKLMYAVAGKGVYQQTISMSTQRNGTPQRVELNPPELMLSTPNAMVLAGDPDSETLVLERQDSCELWRTDGRTLPLRLSLPKAVALSKGARWVAAIEGAGAQVLVLDGTSAATVATLSIPAATKLWFSPDGKWLVVGSKDGYATWSAGDWKPGSKWSARLDTGDPAEISFSADGKLASARQEREIFRLMRFPECTELATLRPPLAIPVRTCLLSPDGTKLWLLANGYRLFEWDLAALRSELADLALSW